MPAPYDRLDAASGREVRDSAHRTVEHGAGQLERLLIVEQAYAEIENRWLRTADDLLVWMMLVDRLIAPEGQHGSSG
jgi:hypothetical protein